MGFQHLQSRFSSLNFLLLTNWLIRLYPKPIIMHKRLLTAKTFHSQEVSSIRCIWDEKVFGSNFALRINKLLTYQHYRSKKPLFGLPFFRTVMPYKQFQEVLLFRQFGDYSEFTNDRLSKIGLMVNTFNKKCHHILVLITRWVSDAMARKTSI